MWRVLVVFAAVLVAADIAAAVVPVPRVEIARSDVRPEIDGRLQDPVWELAAPLGALVQVEPSEGAPPTERTDIRLVTDGTTLFVGVRCYDAEPSEIVAQVLARDALLWQDDVIQILLSPFHDRRSGYLFQVNPNGARRDSLVEDQNQSVNWDGIWEARARIDSEGWTAELAIPFETLNFDPEVEAWGLNIQRRIRRKAEVLRWTSAQQARRFLHLLDAGELGGMTDLHQGKGLDVVPGASLRFDENPLDSGSDRFRLDPTLDIFYKPNPRVTAVLTVNTDFGETEADAFRINLGQFPLFFPERRDFFQQDAGIFDFGGLTGAANGRPFHSRRIGLDSNGESLDLIAGAKLTGRSGPLSIGLLNVQVGDYQLPGRDHIRSKNLGVGRVTLDVFDESRVGLIVTNGDPESDANNTLIGVDSVLRTSRLFGDQQLQQRLWIQHSNSTGTKDRQLAWGTAVEYPNDAINWAAEYRELQENFNPALGRVSRPGGTRQYRGHLRLRHRPNQASSIRFLETRMSANAFTNRDDRLDTRDVDILVAAERRIGDRVELRYSHRFSRVDAGGFDISSGVTIPRGGYNYGGATLILSASSARRIAGRLVFSGGTFYTGTRYDVIPELSLRPNKHWLLSLALRNTVVRLPQGNFAARTASLRLLWQLNPDVSWSTLVQWSNSSDRIGIQSRVRWIIVPGREFFLVFSQDLLDIDRKVRRGQTIAIAKVGWTFRY